MIKYVFDACAIINLLKRGIVKPFLYGATLDLALYETLNALWKEHKLLKNIDEETLKDLISILCKIFNILEIRSIRGMEYQALEIACNENITIYDASYITLAISMNAVLVTDDKKLQKIATKYVSAASSGELENVDVG
ncbi:MAG: type II toxin-antitoxin system VapC family toxin, partial [Crenarchaeota archaeon]|nr:type II toxin-antitoxin system VapC family toxin [Thermoproteota archaeon]